MAKKNWWKKQKKPWWKRLLKYLVGPVLSFILLHLLFPSLASALTDLAVNLVVRDPIILEGKISDNLWGETLTIWNGKIKTSVNLQNSGATTLVSNSESIEYEVYSVLRTYFVNDWGEKFNQLDHEFQLPVYHGDKVDYFPLNLEIPEGMSKGKLVIEIYCPMTISRRCQSHVEKITHEFEVKDPSSLKILAINIAGKDYVDLAILREKIKDIFGTDKILKTAWSWDWKIYSKEKAGGAHIYHNVIYSDISPESRAVRKALLQAFSHLENQAYFQVFDSSTINWATSYLSDCLLDKAKWCQTGPNWVKLDQYSNRFSPSFLSSNTDIDFVISIPY